MSDLTPSDERLINRLNAHPVLKARMVNLLDVVVNASGDLKRADAAEQRVIEEMRQLGLEALENWAGEQVKQSANTTANLKGVQRRGEKNVALGKHFWNGRGQRALVSSGWPTNPPLL